MRNKMFEKMIAGLAVVASVVSLTVQTASADILFSDDFNRTGKIYGSTPSYVNPAYYPSGLTWYGCNDAQASTTAGQPASGFCNQLLAFTPQSGQQYNFTVVAKSPDGWDISVGFGKVLTWNGGYDWWDQDVRSSAFASVFSGPTTTNGTYRTIDNNGVVISPTPGVAGTFKYTPVGDGYNTISMMLDTRSGLASATATLSVNGVTMGSWAADVSSYTGVGYGRYGDYRYSVRSVNLSTIPEPGSLTLLGLVGGGLLLRRKLRQPKRAW